MDFFSLQGLIMRNVMVTSDPQVRVPGWVGGFTVSKARWSALWRSGRVASAV